MDAKSSAQKYSAPRNAEVLVLVGSGGDVEIQQKVPYYFVLGP